MQNLIEEVTRNGNYMRSSHFSCKPAAPGQQTTTTQSICLSTVNVNWEWKVAKGIATRSIMDVDNSQPWTLQSTCCNTEIKTQQHAIQVLWLRWTCKVIHYAEQTPTREPSLATIGRRRLILFALEFYTTNLLRTTHLHRMDFRRVLPLPFSSLT